MPTENAMVIANESNETYAVIPRIPFNGVDVFII